MRPAHLSRVLQEEFLSAANELHTPIMIWGPPGIGKSQIVNQIGLQNSVPVIDIRLSQMEPSDLRGIPFRKDQWVEWAVPALLPNTERHGPAGILFLDEITSAAPSVSAAAYQLILDRRLGEYQVPKAWAIFAAGNRQGDRGVTYAMPAPLANRFAHIELELNLDDWVTWAYGQNIDERIIAFLRFRPELLFEFDPSHNPVAFPSPRSWEFAHRVMKKNTSGDLLLESLKACVGPIAGIEFHAFCTNLDQLPDIDAITLGKENQVPKEIDLQYAIAAALVGRAIKAQQQELENSAQIIGNILNYARRFPQKEMGVMMVSDMHNALGQSLFSIAEFASWSNDVAELILYN